MPPFVVPIAIAGVNLLTNFGMTASQKKTANQFKMGSLRKADEVMKTTEKKMEASNYMQNLGIQKQAIQGALDRVIAQNAAARIGQADSSAAMANASQVQKNLMQGLESARNSEINQYLNIQKSAADRQQQIDDNIASMYLGLGNQAFREAGDYSRQIANLNRQQSKILADTGFAALKYGSEPLTSALETRSFEKGFEGAFEGQDARDYFAGQIKDIGTEDGLNTVTNPALQQALMENKTLGERLGALTANESATNEDFQRFFMENLEGDQFKSLYEGFQPTYTPDPVNPADQDLIMQLGLTEQGL